jgi:hypothetical protein
MTRQEIYHEIEDMFGIVPSMFRLIPDSSLELEWKLFKRVQFDPGPIPNKHRELIGIAIAAGHQVPILRALPHGGGKAERRYARRDRGCGSLCQEHLRLEHVPERSAGGL